MKEKVVILKNNMLDDWEYVIFHAEIPYKVEKGKIENEDNQKISLNDIWVDFEVKFLD